MCNKSSKIKVGTIIIDATFAVVVVVVRQRQIALVRRHCQVRVQPARLGHGALVQPTRQFLFANILFLCCRAAGRHLVVVVVKTVQVFVANCRRAASAQSLDFVGDILRRFYGCGLVQVFA